MKVLIIKPSSLGDVIHALPFLKAVKDSYPGAEVDWVISRNLKGLLEGNPLISKLIIFDKDSWKDPRNILSTLSQIKGLRTTLKAKTYDVVVDLQGLLRSGIMTFLTRSPMKVGFARSREGSWYFYDKKIPDDRAVHAVDRNLEIAKAIGAATGKVEFPLYPDPMALDKAAALTGHLKEYIVIAPSARWKTKRWPAENFARLSKKIHIPCVIIGSKGDREISREMLRYNAQDGKGGTRPATMIDLCGRTDLKTLIAVIAGAKAVVSNDSGPMHIAAALKRPVVALFGPTDPLKTGPYGWQQDRNLKVIRTDTACSPCRKRECRDLACMRGIKVETVFRALKDLLS